jgi:hypothetical protein
MDDCSKLYCKVENLLNITVNDKEYFFKVNFIGERVQTDLEGPNFQAKAQLQDLAHVAVIVTVLQCCCIRVVYVFGGFSRPT